MSTSFLVIFFAVGLALRAGSTGRGGADAFVVWFLIVLPVVLIVYGWTLSACIILAGRFLALRTHYNYCLAMAVIECTYVPLGTILGVFTLIHLRQPVVRQLFEERSGNQLRREGPQ